MELWGIFCADIERWFPYQLWRANLFCSRHHVKPEWYSSMIQQRLAVLAFGCCFPVVCMAKECHLSLFRGLAYAGMLWGLLFDTNRIFKGWSCWMTACFRFLMQQEGSGSLSVGKDMMFQQSCFPLPLTAFSYQITCKDQGTGIKGDEPPKFLHGAGEGWDVNWHCTGFLPFPTTYNYMLQKKYIIWKSQDFPSAFHTDGRDFLYIYIIYI